MKITWDWYNHLEKPEKFEVLMDTLSITNRTPAYYTNWEKVTENTKEIEVSLNTLNYLIGKDNIFDEAVSLLKKQPKLLQAIPILLAIREKDFPVLFFDEKGTIDFLHLNFKEVDEGNIEEYVKFMRDAGLLDFMKNRITNNLVDYVFGVEVGLDSNGRKNRSGDIMEQLVEERIIKICKKNGYEYMKQATATKIKDEWNYDLPTDEAKRRHDFAIFDSRRNKLNIIEVNYYGGGGSKLKAVAGEFVGLSSFLLTRDSSVNFIWITDGQGWRTARNPLFEAFLVLDEVLNLHMLNNGFLEEVLTI